MGTNRFTVEAKKSNSHLTVILVAASPVERMRGRGPVSLFDVGKGVCLLEKQLDIVSKTFPKSDIIVCVGFEAQKVINKINNRWTNVRFIINENYETTNIMHSIGLSYINTMPSDILVIHGDLLFNVCAMNSIVTPSSSILIDTGGLIRKEEIGISLNTKGNVSTISYGLEKKWGQMVYLTSTELTLFKKLMSNFKQHSNKFLHECLNIIINKGGTFVGVEPNKLRIIDIDNQDDLEKAQKYEW